jgi:glycosyltransferase involved in cell wall biosynthesis
MKKVSVIYQADPLGTIASGIDTFIRGILRWAPDDLEISLVGVTTDNNERPVGRWSVCDLGPIKYRFFPVTQYESPETRGIIPLSVRFMAGLMKYKPAADADVFDFHRIEPSLLYWRDKRPKNAVIHQNMQDLYNRSSDIRWNKLPGAYFWLQDKLIPRFESVFVVRSDAVKWYQQRYPEYSERFKFTPTWYDPEVFSPIDPDTKTKIRSRLGVSSDERLIVTAGRLDGQKDPLLLARSIKRLINSGKRVKLVYVGDGVLRADLETYINDADLGDSVTLAGLKSPAEVAEIVSASDLFALSSAYEGMPMCVLEALGAGVPVASTDVGEVKRVVKNEINGAVISERSETALADAIAHCFDNLQDYAGKPCLDAVDEYTPRKVLQPLFENYRNLANKIAP